jgi:hypothetical protein
MAGSGHKKLINNTREKLVSTDFNRMQSFIAARRSNWLRYWIDVFKRQDELGGDIIETPTDSVGTPVLADIYGGLTVIPQEGTLNLHVVAGVVGMLDPDASPDDDDSPYKLIYDPGIDTDGALQMTANSSGSIRIDVIECERVDTVIESDNRDVYDPPTGAFSALPVDKVSRAGCRSPSPACRTAPRRSTT